LRFSLDRIPGPGVTRRTGLALALAGLAGLLAPPRYTAAQSGTTLRIGTFKGYDETFLPLAGLANTPYQTEYHAFNSSQLIIEAMNARALDFGLSSEIPVAFGAAAHANMRVVAVLKGDVNNQAVLVPKNSPVQNIAELKGKRVGYVRGTTAHYFLLRMLWAAGLQFSDIQAINLNPTDGAAAFYSGDIDAWAIYGYPIDFAIARGKARVLRTAEGVLSGNYAVIVTPETLADPAKRQAAADYLVRLGKGFDWIEANKQQWAQAVAPVINVPLPFVEAQYAHESQPEKIVPIDDAAVASAQQVADTFAKAGVLPATVDVAPYFDRSFYQGKS
jgi:sulfonate transport system substrate-binding protein